jgi:Acyl-CoA reductase (LuxC)
MKHHLWQGEWIDDAEAERRLDRLEHTSHDALATPLDPELVIAAADRLATDERSTAVSPDLARFLSAESLLRQLRTELGERPRLAEQKLDGRSGDAVEAWEPLGLLAHVVPANVDTAGPVSLIEGLLSGNANIIKTSPRSGLGTQRLAADLIAMEPCLAPFTIVLRCDSSRRSWLRQMCHHADGVVVWGSEAAVAGVADLVPAGARLIAWGPKISFGYLTEPAWADHDVLAALCHDICATDQQACTSPQVIYLDTARDEQVWTVAESIAAVLSEVDTLYPAPAPDPAEQAEITNAVLVARHEAHAGLTRVLSDPDGRWHVIAEANPALRASPLYRTIWVKPLPRAAIVPTLRPMRRYLQTAGISPANTSPGLIQALVSAGVQRVTPAGSMHESYPGEPHDGEYALRRYSRRITIRLDA